MKKTESFFLDVVDKLNQKDEMAIKRLEKEIERDTSINEELIRISDRLEEINQMYIEEIVDLDTVIEPLDKIIKEFDCKIENNKKKLTRARRGKIV